MPSLSRYVMHSFHRPIHKNAMQMLIISELLLQSCKNYAIITAPMHLCLSTPIYSDSPRMDLVA